MAADRLTRDWDLIRRIGSGDEEALRSLVYLYTTWLVEVANGILKEPDLAEEVVHEVFIHLWRTRDQLGNLRQISVAAFLHRSVRNRALDVQRRERAQVRVADAFEQLAYPRHEVENTGARTLEHTEFRAAVDRALTKLQPRMREIFLMHTHQEMSPAEIAEALGISASTVYPAIYRAYKILAGELQEWRESSPKKDRP